MNTRKDVRVKVFEFRILKEKEVKILILKHGQFSFPSR